MHNKKKYVYKPNEYNVIKFTIIYLIVESESKKKLKNKRLIIHSTSSMIIINQYYNDTKRKY